MNFTSSNWSIKQTCAPLNGCTLSWDWTGGCAFGSACSTCAGLQVCSGGGIQIRRDQGVRVESATVRINQSLLATSYTARMVSGQTLQLARTGPADANYRTFDGSALIYSVPTATIRDRDGNYEAPPDGSTVFDSNGNSVSSSTSGLTDSVGRIIPEEVSTTDPNDLAQCDNSPLPTYSATVWNLPAPTDASNTSTAKVIFCRVNFHLYRNSLDVPFDKYRTFVQSIVLPNGSKWKFEYQANEGDVTKITLPTGGSISYTWGSREPCSPNAEAPRVATRTVDPGDGTPARTWTYNWPAAAPFLVTDPQGNDTLYYMNAATGCPRYESQRQVFQGASTGGTLLKTVQTQYEFVANPYDHSSTAGGAFPTSVTTIWPNGASTIQSKVVNNWDGPGNTGQFTFYQIDPNSSTAYTSLYGDLFNIKNYDNGTNTPGPLLRETVNSYKFTADVNYKNNNLLDLLSSVQIKNVSGTQVALTTYGYDEAAYPLQASGVTTQHTSPPNSYRGNQTSANRWLNTTGGYLSSHNYFYDTGTIQQAIDPGTHTTTYTYSSAFAGAYPTQTQLNDTHSPDLASHISLANYDFNSGVVLSTTDENSRATNYLYDLLSRPRQITYRTLGKWITRTTIRCLLQRVRALQFHKKSRAA